MDSTIKKLNVQSERKGGIGVDFSTCGLHTMWVQSMGLQRVEHSRATKHSCTLKYPFFPYPLVLETEPRNKSVCFTLAALLLARRKRSLV